MKKNILTFLILGVIAFVGSTLARGLAMNIHVLASNHAIIDKVVDSPENWSPKNPEKHYQKKLKIYEQYSPRLFWLKTTIRDTISCSVVEIKSEKK